MALEKYKAKRNFSESPEPAGDTRHRSPAGRTPRFFCVQKHLASHLHYDFRLEHNGVLLSWAVPKGPSLDPATKRLAMHVEDHPIEYGDFEGVIPSGYGAGIVMLWDRGTWTPEVDDVDAALKKGDLKLTLDGFKLKGSWVLVRTKGAMGRRRRRSLVAADQAPRRLGGRRRHRRVRAAERQERGRLRRHPRPGQPGDLDLASAGGGRRDRRDVQEDRRARARRSATSGRHRPRRHRRRRSDRRRPRRKPTRSTEGGARRRKRMRRRATKKKAARTTDARDARLLQQPLAEHRPDGKRQPTPIVPGDLGAPERAEHRLNRRTEVAQRQRFLVLGRVARHRLV